MTILVTDGRKSTNCGIHFHKLIANRDETTVLNLAAHIACILCLWDTPFSKLLKEYF
jgi:hypothetical protein